MNDKRLTELTEMHERGTIKRGHIDEMLAELRRLESVNAQLLEALIVMVDNFGSTSSDDVHGLGEARAAITKATGEAK